MYRKNEEVMRGEERRTEKKELRVRGGQLKRRRTGVVQEEERCGVAGR